MSDKPERHIAKMSTPNVNPIIPGYAPDPSIVLVDGAYFLVNSSFQMFPGLPIYTSNDLVKWKQIGNAINRASQLDLVETNTLMYPKKSGAVLLASGGTYAPTIRHHKGTFYVICTNVLHGGPTAADDKCKNFIVSTTDIYGSKWSDPVMFDFKGIDPSVLFDSNGKVYVCGSRGPGPWCTINLFEVDVRTGKKLSEEKTIWKGTGGIYPEGPHIYPKDGFYYLMISEGGTHEDHMITVARSRDVWGPYESFKNNPVLTAKGTGEYIQYTGHLDAFQDKQGEWWGVCLGVRKEPGGRFIMGRETFLTKCHWEEGGWPTFDRVALSPPALARSGASEMTAEKGVDWLYIRNVDTSRYTLSPGEASIRIRGTRVSLRDPAQSPSFMGKRQRKLTGSAAATLHFPSEKPCEAGLVIYKDEHRFAALMYSTGEKILKYKAVNKAKKLEDHSSHDMDHVDMSGELSLKIRYTEKEYRFYCSTKEGKDSHIATLDTLFLTGPDFVGPVIGAHVVAADEEAEVDFVDLGIS